MFLVLVFIVHLHYMFRPLIGGHLQVICDKIYSTVATVYVNGSVELTCLRQVPRLCKSIYIYKNVTVRLCTKVTQNRKSPKVVHRWRCNLDTTMKANTRVFVYTYYIYRLYIYI
jgi:hypothetical protein